MRLIVLAAGFATRMYPLTKEQPKPLLEVGGRTILDRLLDQLAASGRVSGATVVTNHKFVGHFERWLAARRGPLPVELVDDGVERDTENLGALRDLALALGRRPAGEDLVVSGGDNLFLFPLEPYFVRFARDRVPLLPLRRVEGPLVPKTYGEVELDAASGRIMRMREKPADPRSRLAAFCLYFVPAQVGGWLDEYLASGGNHDAPGHFFAWLAGRTRVDGLEIEGTWHDIGSLETLERARREVGPGPDAGPGSGARSG